MTTQTKTDRAGGAEAGARVSAVAAVLVVAGRPVSDAALRELVPGGVVDRPAIERLAAGMRGQGIACEIRDAGPPGGDPLVGTEAIDLNIEAGLGEQAAVLLNAIGEGVCLADASGRVLWGNSFYESLPGAIRDEIGVHLRESAGVFARASSAELCVVSEQAACKFEISGPGGEGGGGEQFYELFVTPAPPRPEAGGDFGESAERRDAEDGRAAVLGPERVAGVVRNVTASRRNAAKLDAIDRAGSELVQLDADAIRGKNNFERLKLLEKKIVKLTRDVLSYDHFVIFLLDSPREAAADDDAGENAAEHPPVKLEPVISAGLPQAIEDLSLAAEMEGSGISGYVAATGKSYLCRDASSDERYLPGLPGCRSSLTVPLRLNDTVIGIMDVESQSADAFDDEERQFLEIFGRHVALALHMLDLLVVERCAVNESLTGRVGDELSEPLNDIIDELELLRGGGMTEGEAAEHLARIGDDVDSIRRRIRDVAAGPQSLLGVERAMAVKSYDPMVAGRRILVADDQARIRKIIGELLTARGATVTVCADGGEAIETLSRVGSGEIDGFDLVISDIRMPDHNGYEVFSASKRVQLRTPVILMTGFGYDPHHSIVRASQQGLHSVLFKPFELERLLDEVRKALTVE